MNPFFEAFLQKVMATPHWQVMVDTVEDSPWHREANVAVHTLMSIDVYMNKFASKRSDREQVITLMALLFHDFGKPEAEETLEKKDQPGVMYRRYAGHEPVSANEFMSFICDQHELREMFFAEGYDWYDVRRIKFMIEHHLPYGLKNPTKRQDLRDAVGRTLGSDEECFWDMLRSDAAGRISDDHETKLQNVEDWIGEFRHIAVSPLKPDIWSRTKKLFMLYGVSGAGKSTWIKENIDTVAVNVVNEDDWRLEYAGLFMDRTDLMAASSMSKAEYYDVCWKFCHMNPDSKYDTFAKMRFDQILADGKTIVLDRMNQGKKGRGKWINPAKAKGYSIRSVEFYISERVAKERQATRGDKFLPGFRVHQIYMQQETPWLGPEVDGVEIVAP